MMSATNDASSLVTAAIAARRLVADVMVTCPKTFGPECPLERLRAFFEDDHLHMALIVAPDGVLVTTIERPDLAAATSSSTPGAKLGTLIGRTARPADPLGPATATLLRERRRRLAVVDDGGRLLGLLCLKKDGTGYCSDEGIRQRAQDATQPTYRPPGQQAGPLRRVHHGAY
jgi:CBS-domain-containing membrane protein